MEVKSYSKKLIQVTDEELLTQARAAETKRARVEALIRARLQADDLPVDYTNTDLMRARRAWVIEQIKRVTNG